MPEIVIFVGFTKKNNFIVELTLYINHGKTICYWN
jgi:hypothetical protein